MSAGNGGWFSFLRSRPAQILTLLLLAQAGIFYGSVNSGEMVPPVPPLADFPKQAGAWTLAQEGVVEQEVRDVLQADDLLSRTYYVPGRPLPANLFIAYFRSQRTGKAPHSPKNCLPGSGWTQESAGTVTIRLADGASITVNRYIVARGQSRSLVMYWYQTRDRVIASEYAAKMYLVWDSIRLNRSDTALVRVVVPVVDGGDELSEAEAVSFLQSVFPHIGEYFPF